MSDAALQHKETLLIEILLCGLDVRSIAGAAESPMLTYLAELLVKRARQELDAVALLRLPRSVGADE